MKVIGLIGGMSWESSLEYYRIINETVKEKPGGLHSARSVLYLLDFADIEKLQHTGMWKEATDALIDAAQRIEKAGAECLLICFEPNAQNGRRRLSGSQDSLDPHRRSYRRGYPSPGNRERGASGKQIYDGRGFLQRPAAA